jgi:chromosome segregation ATPase
MPYQNFLSTHLDEVLTAAKLVQGIVHNIDATPALVAELKAEIEGLEGQIRFLQSTLLREKTAYETERRQHHEESRHDLLINSGIADDLGSELASAKANLRAVQDEIAARKVEFEKLAREVNRLERYLPTYPT